MASAIPVYLEIGSKRVFACALDWPGWCRSARDEEAARETLVEYGRRYKKALGRAAAELTIPKDATALRVVERVKGNATTDFGAPATAVSSDQKKVSTAEARRLVKLLRASWTAFDKAGEKAKGKTLAKGPRGGGRSLTKIVQHVLEAEGAYLSKIGGVRPKGGGAKELRDAWLDTFHARIAGEPITTRVKTPWLPRYAVRRSAWHVLDHTWEIEDRSVDD